MRIAAGSFDINWGLNSLYNNLFRGVAEKGVSVDVYSREKISERVKNERERVRFHQIKTPNTPGVPQLLNRFYFNYSFYRSVYKEDIDLIHGLCFNLYPCHRLDIPYILDDIVYPTYIEFIKNEVPKLGQWIYHKTYVNMLPFTKTVKTECERADFLVVPSEFQREKLLECFELDEEKIRLIPYGTGVQDTVRNQKNESEGGFNVILFIGNDYLRKGLHYLIEAMESVVKSRPKTILLVLGGQLKNQARSKATVEYVKKLIFEKKLKNNIFFMGQVSHEETQKYLDMCDVFCLPTLSDSCSRAVLEAISREKPVVTTPNSGFPEVNKVGIQVPPRDSHAISDALLKLLEDAKLREKKKMFCRKLAIKYSWTKIADQYVKLYEELSEH